MHKLSVQQKIENYNELISLKEIKIQKLKEEVDALQAKLKKLKIYQSKENQDPTEELDIIENNF